MVRWLAAPMLLSAAAIVTAQSGSTLADRPATGGARAVIISTTSFDYAVMQLSQTSRVPVALERIGTMNVNMSGAGTSLAGRTVGDMLNELTSRVEVLPAADAGPEYRYTWRDNGALIQITPFAGRATFLDRVIPSFDIRNRPPGQAVQLVHQLFNPDYAVRITSPPGVLDSIAIGFMLGDAEARRLNDRVWARRVTLSRANATVRELLDAIVMSIGEMSWRVDYRDVTGAYDRCIISLESVYGAVDRYPASVRQTN